MADPIRPEEPRMTSISYPPPAHRGGQYAEYFDNNPDEAHECDALYLRMKDSFAAWQGEVRQNAFWAQFGMLGFWVRAHLHNAIGAEPPQIPSDQSGSQYVSLAQQYNQRCLPKLGAGEETAVVVPTRIDALPRSVLDVAVDGLTDAVVQGGQFVYDHPGLVVGGIALGALLVVAPQVAPFVLVL